MVAPTFFISGVRGQYKLIVEHNSGVLLFKQFGRINRSCGRKQAKSIHLDARVWHHRDDE